MPLQVIGEDVDRIHWIPEATIQKPLAYFAGLGLQLAEGNDELDSYVGSHLLETRGICYVLRHYRGYPPDTTTVYLPYEFRDENIPRIIGIILDDLGVQLDEIGWQRTD